MMNARNVLLVDTDNDSLRINAQALRKAEFVVHTAISAAEAIQSATLHVPSVVISELTLSGSDGFSLCQALHHDLGLEHVPFIALTFDASIESRIKAIKMGIFE